MDRRSIVFGPAPVRRPNIRDFPIATSPSRVLALSLAMITLPGIDLRHDVTHPYAACHHRTLLFSHGRQLLVKNNEVVLLKGLTVSKKLTYDEPIVAATFTSFNNTDEALVVCLRKSATVYFDDGRSYVVSFPFLLKQAFAFDLGLVLEKDNQSFVAGNMHPPHLHAARFLTLVDPIGEFRIVTTSSTSIISPHEELKCFPSSLSTLTLCATYNTQDHLLVFYHIRTAARAGPKKFKPRRKTSLLSTPNPSRILEDDDSPHELVTSLTMDKKRTSTLLLGVLSMARMSSDPSHGDKIKSSYLSLEFSVARKDMILLKVDVLHPKAAASDILVLSLVYDDQEALVVCNTATSESTVYMFRSLLASAPRYISSVTVQCAHAIPLVNEEHPGWLLTLKDVHTVSMVHPFLSLVAPDIHLQGNYGPIARLVSSFGDQVAMAAMLGRTYGLSLVLDPSSDIVARCLSCFKYLSGSRIHQTVWMMWRLALMLHPTKDEWSALVAAILAMVYDFEATPSSQNHITQLLPLAKQLHVTFPLDYDIDNMVPYMVLALHLIYEETRLDVLAHAALHQLGCLLAQLTLWMGWPAAWHKYYMVGQLDTGARFLRVYLLDTPPNLFELLGSLFSNKIIRYLTFSQLAEELDTVDAIITPRTYKVLKLYELVVSPQYGPSDVVDHMAEYGLTLADLELFPVGISVPLKENISICQENPAFEWNASTLEIVGRKDLTMLLSQDSQPRGGISPNTRTRKEVSAILGNLLDKSESVVAWDGQLEADRINITKLIFDYDRRYYEITMLLHQTRTQLATLVTDEAMLEYDVTVLQRELAAVVALRTLTLPLGRAALFYSGRMPLLTEKFPIPKFNLNTLIAPAMKTIVLSEGTLRLKFVLWGYFHNGVSSGLSISKDSKGISGSWIIFNKPPELNAQHAGFLLGLGLNGHLKKLEEWHIYNYLGPKHPLTSVGLLVGMAASLRGSMDNKLTKVLSVHAVALLPQGANDLNVPTIVQSAGLIGIGLLYLETQHRRMSEVLLSQLCGLVYHNDSEEIHEGYRLAAGIALGFVNLGKGNDLRGLNDTHVIDKLLSLAISMKDSQPVQELDKLSLGAILALGFIYLRTGNSIIAEKLRVPAAEQLLDYVRLDLLMLRCVAKNLIMWDDIGDTIDWVESEVPPVLLSKYSLNNIEVLDSDQLAYFNILGGACLLMAIKYASTHHMRARNTLLHFLDLMMVILMTPAQNYDQKIAAAGASHIQNLMALCLSLIMAGSGDLETFRRLRILHNDTHKNMGYGNYMATSMGLGFLFLGGGQYAFGNSDFAVACLLTSLYPVFPSDNSEYEVHLQVMRHFWALSVEPRCLIVRDVNTHEPCKVPIVVKMKNGSILEEVSPCLLPPMDDILCISTESPDHFRVVVDFSVNSEYLEILKRLLTIFVYRRQNYQILKLLVDGLLRNKNKALQIDNGEVEVDLDVAKLLGLSVMSKLNDFEKQSFLHEISSDADPLLSGISIFNILDDKIELERLTSNPRHADDLWNLRLLFAFSDRHLSDKLSYVSLGFIEQLKQQAWQLAK